MGWALGTSLTFAGFTGDVALATVDGALYALAKHTSDPGHLYRYDAGTWTRLADLPDTTVKPYLGDAFVGHAGTLVVLSFQGTRRYDIGTDTWSTGTPLATLRNYAAVGQDGDDVYVAGGYDAVNTSDQLERYSIAGDTVTTLAPMDLQAGELGGAVSGGYFYVWGGRHQDGITNAYEQIGRRYSIAGDTWSTISGPPPTDGLGYPIVAALDDGTLLVGGGWDNDASNYTDAFWTYDPDDDSFTSSDPAGVGTAGALAGGAVLDGDVSIMGTSGSETGDLGIFAGPAPPGVTPIPEMTAELVYLADLSAQIEDLSDTTRGWSFRAEINETGGFTITFQNDDPALASVDLPNSLINFYIDTVLAFTGLLESYRATDVSPQEEAEETTVYQGRGVGALADRITIYPALGVGRRPIEEDIHWDYSSLRYVEGPEWVPATAVTTVAGAQASWGGGGNLWDPDFPDPTADVLWTSDGSDITAPAGSRYGRGLRTISADGVYQLDALMDNYGEVFVDGVLICSVGQNADGTMNTFKQTTKATVELTAGEHLIAWRGVNYPIAGNNPAGVAWALYPLDATGVLGTLEAHSDAALDMVTADPAGMTPGQVVGIVLDEYETRAGAALFDRGFDDVYDKNGTEWAKTSDIATKVFTKAGMLLREMSATYIDWVMRVDLDTGRAVLDLYRIGESGVTPGVTYERGVNLGSLVRSGEAPQAGALGVRWGGGWAERVRTSSIDAYGRIEDVLGLGAQGSLAEAYRMADGQLDDFAQPREQTDITIEPATDAEVPWAGYEPIGATIDLEGTDHRILAMGATVDDDTGKITFNATLNDNVVLNAEERVFQAIGKMVRGTLGGRSKVAQPVVPVYVPRGQVPPAECPSFTESFDTADGALGPDLPWSLWAPGDFVLKVVSNEAAQDPAHGAASGSAVTDDYVTGKDSYTEAIIGNAPLSGSYLGVIARAAGGGTGYMFGVQNVGGTDTDIFLTRWTASTGVGIAFDTLPTALAPGDVLRVEASGLTIKGFINGAEVISVVEPGYGYFASLYQSQGALQATGGGTFSDFEFGALC